MKSSSRNNILAPEVDPYLALNRGLKSVLVETADLLRENAARADNFEPSLIHGLTDSLRKLRESLDEAAKVERKPAKISVEAPKLTIPDFPEVPKAWDAEITSRDSEGRAKTFRFTAV